MIVISEKVNAYQEMLALFIHLQLNAISVILYTCNLR